MIQKRTRTIQEFRRPRNWRTVSWDAQSQTWDSSTATTVGSLGWPDFPVNSKMIDYLGRPNDRISMHDCLHRSHYGSYIMPDDTTLFQWQTGNSPLAKRCEADVGTVISNSLPLAKRNHTLQNMGKLLELPFLPREIDLKRDPFDTEFSIWFLLADISDATKMLAKLRRDCRRWSDLNRRYRRFTARDFHDSNLGVQFGILPTVTDLKDFVRICRKWQDAYVALRTQQDTIHRWRSPILDVTDKLLGSDQIWYEEVTGMPGIQHLRVYERDFRAAFRRTLHFRFTCPELTGWLSRVKQLIDAFGVLDPAAIWDRIPWSFVCDWFYPIGSWLHRNRPRLFPADLVCVDYCESMKLTWQEERSVYAYINPNGIGAPSEANLNYQSFAQDYHTVYVRKRFRPPPTYIQRPQLDCDVLTWRRISIAASLVAQRLPR